MRWAAVDTATETLPLIRVVMLIDSQALFEITNLIRNPFYQIMLCYKIYSKLNLYKRKTNYKYIRVVVYKIGITAVLISIREVAALFSPHG